MKKNAFTLTETIFVVLIVGIGMVLFSAVFLSSWKNYEINLRHIHLRQQIDSAFRVVNEDVMEASDLSISADSFTLTIDYPTADALIASQNPFFQQVVYTLTPNGIIRDADGSAQNIMNMPVDTNVSGFQSLTTDNLGIILNIKIDDVVFGHTISQRGSTAVMKRN